MKAVTILKLDYLSRWILMPSIEIAAVEAKQNRCSQSQLNINYDSIVNRRPLTRLIAFSCAMPYA